MDVCHIHCSVLTFKIYIILCCHWRSISDEIIPFFLIKFIFRMIEMACLRLTGKSCFDSVASGVVVELFYLKPNIHSAAETQGNLGWRWEHSLLNSCT